MTTKIQLIENTKLIPLDQSWVNVIRYVRNEAPFGRMTIEFKEGKPFEATLIKKTIRF